MSDRPPVLFVGHGSPLNAITDNSWSRGFRSLGDALPPLRAILAVSAHWYGIGTRLTDSPKPVTIHDFWGFPRALHEVRYPAPGDPGLARRIAARLADLPASTNGDWGLDHGTWSVLVHLRPQADVPVVQLSLDERLTPAQHLALGQRLAPLRDEGVLILASGNLVHNLEHALSHSDRGEAGTPAWAAAFDADAARALEQHDHDFLVRALAAAHGRRAHPTPEHYLPLLYAAGAAVPGSAVRFPITGFDLGSLSMRSVRFD